MGKIKILITGTKGYVGKSLHDSLKFDYDVQTLTRSDFDLVDSEAMQSWFKNKRFDVVIHAATSGGSRLKHEDQTIIDQNLKMYYNLLSHRDKYRKFISFGSGAEIFKTDTPYGISKKIIADSMLKFDNFYNLRIFAVFDENELITRFIKGNIIRSIKGEPMIIHSNKIMDFFYMEDLISLVKNYIVHGGDKEINCSYEQKYTLKNIGEMINHYADKKVPIIIENENEFSFYCGNPKKLPINEIGLEEGIRKTYYKLSRSMLSSCRDVV